MRECHGTVVVAFERIHIEKAYDKPKSEHQSELRDIALPTVWNQLEAAMAYANDLPILILVQRGTKREGMLSDRLEWCAQEVELDPSIFQTTEFKGIFDKNSASSTDIRILSIGSRFSWSGKAKIQLFMCSMYFL